MRNIKYFCHQNRSGYAQAAQDYIFSLKNSGQYNIELNLLQTQSIDKISMTPQRLAELTYLLKNKNDDGVEIYHCIPDMQKKINKKNKKIGFATFETFDPPNHWVDILNSNDAVICPSKFCETTFRLAGVTKPIFHIPHCINTCLYNPQIVSTKEFSEFTFLFLGTWRKRKGWEILIESWFKEFSKNDNVRLLIKTDKPTVAKQDIDKIQKTINLQKEFAPISFETKILTEFEIPLLIKKVDCMICPTSGEGFGLPGLQAMALGTPLIITNFSGCKDYANEDTATMINVSGFILYNERDSIPQFINKKWAHLTVKDVSHSMRYVIENRDVIKNKANFASDFVLKEFNYQKNVEKFNNMMSVL